MESKYISNKKYYKIPQGFYDEKNVHKEIERIKEKTKMDKPKRFRFYIEKVYVFGNVSELFVPGYKYYLWVNKI